MPGFYIPDVVTGRNFQPADFQKGKGTLVIFLCRHCPYVVHMRDEIVRIAAEFAPDGLGTLAISSNDAVKYPDDAPDKLREMAMELKWPFPLLFDENQKAARSFGAVCTPDIFLYDGEGKLFYRGRLDASTPGNGQPVTGADLRAAISALLSGSPAPDSQLPSIGCSIKWKEP